MPGFERIVERAREANARIAFAEAADPRVIRAAAELERQGIATPVLVEGTAADAAARVHEGRADGAVVPTTSLGTLVAHAGQSPVSSLFLTEPLLAFGFPTIVACPGAEGLAEIGAATATSLRRVAGCDPRVAFLSFSTHGSAAHADVDTVRRAAELLASSEPGYLVDGELQLDAALAAAIAAKKAPDSPLGGRANVLIFPNVDAGAIGVEIAGRFGESVAIGPMVQGLSRPFSGWAPDASEREIVLTAAVVAAQSAAASL